jgi:AcrR family transcriptional regulator
MYSKSTNTKELILDKAFLLFYENGFANTSVDKIMEATKLTKGAFYHHFKSKKEIGIAVITERIRIRIVENMIEPLRKVDNPRDLLIDLFTHRINSFSDFEKRNGCPANNFINEIGDSEIAYQLALRSIIEEWKGALIHFIEKGKQTGAFSNEIVSSSVAVYLISAFEGIRGIRKVYHEDSILDAYLDALKHYINQLN